MKFGRTLWFWGRRWEWEKELANLPWGGARNTTCECPWVAQTRDSTNTNCPSETKSQSQEISRQPDCPFTEDGRQAIGRNAGLPCILFPKHKCKCLCKIPISLRFVFGLVCFLEIGCISLVLVEWEWANHFIFTFHWSQIGQMQINTSFKYTSVTGAPPLRPVQGRRKLPWGRQGDSRPRRPGCAGPPSARSQARCLSAVRTAPPHSPVPREGILRK